MKVGEYQQLIDPKRRVGPGITALTGITQQMVDDTGWLYRTYES